MDLVRDVAYAAYDTGQRFFELEVAPAMNKIYTMPGLEKLSKVVISTGKFMDQVVLKRQVFALFVEAHSSLKDLYYATQIFGGTVEAIKAGGAYRAGAIRLTDFLSKLFLSIASYCDTAKFLQKKGLVDFPVFSQLSDRLGGFKVAGFAPFNHEPFVQLRFSPKCFFVFVACAIEVGQFAVDYAKLSLSGHVVNHRQPPAVNPPPGLMTPDNLLKQVTNIGKMILISCGAYQHRMVYIIVDLATQHLGLVAHLIKKA